MLSQEEAKHVYDKGAKRLIIGTGQTGLVKLSEVRTVRVAPRLGEEAKGGAV